MTYMCILIALLVVLCAYESLGFSYAPATSTRLSSTRISVQLKMAAGAAERRDYGPSAGYKSSSSQQNIGFSSQKDSSTNLLKNMIGAGVFNVPAKVSAISTSPSVLASVFGIVAGISVWASYNFYTIGEACRVTKTSTYADAWGKTVGENSKFIINTIMILAPIAAFLSNTIVLTDIFTLLFKSVGVPASLTGNRNLVIALVSSFILYPLCIKDNLDSLKKVSLYVNHESYKGNV